MKKRIQLIPLLVFVYLSMMAQVPVNWQSRGIGGGGGLFSPSMNPVNTEEYYVACDMSELFHTTDFGLSYEVVDFRQLQASNPSKVWFTTQQGLRYCINYRTGTFLIAKSTDNGLTWQNVPGLEPWEWVYTLFVDYHNPHILVTNFWSAILISLDGGNSFLTIHQTNIGSGAHLAGVFFDYPDIYIGLNEGLLVSHDGGLNFSFENYPGMIEGQGFYSFTGAKQNDTVRLMGTTIDIDSFWNAMPASHCWETVDDIYRMDYGLSNWISVGATINWGIDYPMLIAMAENNIHTAYIGGGDAGSFPIILKTTSGGDHWQHNFLTYNNQNIYTGWTGYLGDKNWWYPGVVLGMDVSRFNADTIVFSDLMSVHKSANGGTTWYQAYTAPSCQHPPGSPSPKKQIYLSVGIENTSAWSLVWIDEQNIFAGFSDISGIRSTDGGLNWNFDYTGHDQNTMYWVGKHPENGTLYAATSTVHDIYQTTHVSDAQIEQPGSGGKMIFSENGGEHWQTLHDFGMPVYYFAFDPGNPERIYASAINYSQGTGGIWKTDNLSSGANSTWVKLPDPPRTEGHPATIVVLNDGKVLTSWSARQIASGAFTPSSGIFLFDPASGSWEDLSHPNMYYWTKDIVVNPNDPDQNIWYACVWSGWGGPANNKGGIYRTRNRGQTWTWIWDTHRVESCTFNPLYPGQLFATTEWQGLWVSNNINDAAPVFEEVENFYFMHPFRLFFNPFRLNELWVSSFGNGLKTAILSNHPHTLGLENQTFLPDSDTCIAALNSIVIHNVMFEAGSNVVLEAGQNISFLTGITVEPGANVLARIEQVQFLCTQPTALPAYAKIQFDATSAIITQKPVNFRLFSINPNPNHGVFTIEIADAENNDEIYIEVHSLSGALLMKQSFQGSRSCMVSLPPVPNGVYILEIRQGEKSGAGKIIKM